MQRIGLSAFGKHFSRYVIPRQFPNRFRDFQDLWGHRLKSLADDIDILR
jgi:hypothetical protein